MTQSSCVVMSLFGDGGACEQPIDGGNADASGGPVDASDGGGPADASGGGSADASDGGGLADASADGASADGGSADSGHADGGHGGGGGINDHDCLDKVNPPPAGATRCKLDLGSGIDTYWTDSDGVDPFTPGCHTEWQDANCAFNYPPDRNFGELCLDGDRLVESNPSPPGHCHTHAGDVGHPDIISCNTACKALANWDANVTGHCEDDGVTAYDDLGAMCFSAKCVCTGP